MSLTWREPTTSLLSLRPSVNSPTGTRPDTSPQCSRPSSLSLFAGSSPLVVTLTVYGVPVSMQLGLTSRPTLTRLSNSSRMSSRLVNQAHPWSRVLVVPMPLVNKPVTRLLLLTPAPTRSSAISKPLLVSSIVPFARSLLLFPVLLYVVLPPARVTSSLLSLNATLDMWNALALAPGNCVVSPTSSKLYPGVSSPSHLALVVGQSVALILVYLRTTRILSIFPSVTPSFSIRLSLKAAVCCRRVFVQEAVAPFLRAIPAGRPSSRAAALVTLCQGTMGQLLPIAAQLHRASLASTPSTRLDRASVSTTYSRHLCRNTLLHSSVCGAVATYVCLFL